MDLSEVKKYILSIFFSKTFSFLVTVSLPIYLVLEGYSLLTSSIVFSWLILVDLVSSPIAGTIIKGKNYKKIMVGSDVISLLLLFPTLLVFSNLLLFMLFLSIIKVSLTFFAIAKNVLASEKFTEEELIKINSVDSVITNVLEIVIPLLTVIILQSYGFSAILLVCILSLATSIFFEIKITYKGSLLREEDNSKVGIRSVFTILKKSGCIFFILALIISNVLTNPQEEIYYPNIFQNIYNLNLIFLSFGYGIFAITSILTSLYYYSKKKNIINSNRLIMLVMVDILLLGVVGLAMFLNSSWFIIIFYVVQIVYGVISTVIGISFITLLQTNINVSDQSIVFGWLNTIMLFFVPIGQLIIGFGLEAFGLQTILIFTCIIGIGMVLGIYFTYYKVKKRSIDNGEIWV